MFCVSFPFLLSSVIFVWAGTYASSTEKTWAMLKADGNVLLRPEAEIIWVTEGFEPTVFKHQFVDWDTTQRTGLVWECECVCVWVNVRVCMHLLVLELTVPSHKSLTCLGSLKRLSFRCN